MHCKKSVQKGYLYRAHQNGTFHLMSCLQIKTKVFGFFGTDHLRTKIIINDETLEQVSQFTYLGCSISYQFSNDVEFKLEKFL